MTDPAADGLLRYLGETDVVEISTRTRDGREIRTPIWSVVAGGEGYVRNGWGEQSAWYRRAVRNGLVSFSDGPRRFAVGLERVAGQVLDLVDEAYLRKYRGQPTEAVVRDPARAFTFRVLLLSAGPEG